MHVFVSNVALDMTLVTTAHIIERDKMGLEDGSELYSVRGYLNIR